MKQTSVVKHLDTKLPITVETFRHLFDHWSNTQRLEVVKSLIWTAPDTHDMLAKVQQLVASRSFTETVD